MRPASTPLRKIIIRIIVGATCIVALYVAFHVFSNSRHLEIPGLTFVTKRESRSCWYTSDDSACTNVDYYTSNLSDDKLSASVAGYFRENDYDVAVSTDSMTATKGGDIRSVYFGATSPNEDESLHKSTALQACAGTEGCTIVTIFR